MGETIITGMTSDLIRTYWDQLETLVEKPLKKTEADKYYSPKDVLEKCMRYEWQCWVASSEKDKIDCVFITHIDVYPKCKTFVIHLVGGENLKDWLPMAWDIFKRYAKAHECVEIVGMGRTGWTRVLSKVEPNEFEIRYGFSVEV